MVAHGLTQAHRVEVSLAWLSVGQTSAAFFTLLCIYDHDAEQVLMMMCLPKFGILMSLNIQVELIPARTLYIWKLDDYITM